MNHYADLRRGAASDYDRAWHQPQPTRLPNEVPSLSPMKRQLLERQEVGVI